MIADSLLARSAASRGDSGSPLIAALAVAAAMVLGGSGSPAPSVEMALQLLMAGLFCWWLLAFPPVPRQRGRIALALAALILVLPLLQLVPLPPALWQALPGREVERGSLALVGAADGWRPLSLAPARTFASLLALVPPAMVLVMTAALGPAGRSMIVGMIAGVTFLAIVVGAAQATGGEGNPFRFYVADTGYLSGFQANHNSAADVLLIGMVAYAVAVQDWLEQRPGRLAGRMPGALVLGGAALMSVGVFLTASRAGTALLPVAWAGVYAATRPLWRVSPRRLALAVAAMALAVVAVLLMLRSNGVVGGVLRRYDFGSELRPQLWADSLYAARTYFPVGAGMGAFFPVFIAAERLEAVDTTLPNRAHNDFLELVIEAGLPGLVVLAALALILARFAWVRLRDPSPRVRRQAIFATAAFTVVALHSQVDYPLRSISLACVAAAAAGLLVPVSQGRRGADGPGNV